MASQPDPDRVRLVQEAIAGRLLPDLVHQLRNPINSLLTGAELLEDKGEQVELRDKLLPVLSRSAERLRDILSHTDAWQGPPPESAFELRGAIVDAIAFLQCRRHTLTIHEPKVCDEPLLIPGKSNFLWTILLSLLEESVCRATDDLWIKITVGPDTVDVTFEHDLPVTGGRKNVSSVAKKTVDELASYLGCTVSYDDSEQKGCTRLTLPTSALSNKDQK